MQQFVDPPEIVCIFLQDRKAVLQNKDVSGTEVRPETDSRIPLPLVLDKFKVGTTGLCGELEDRKDKTSNKNAYSYQFAVFA